MKIKKQKNKYSIIKSLREQKKSNEYFEVLLSNLTLEELITLKLELSLKAIGFPLLGYPIWNSINFIIKEALIKSTLSITKSNREACRLLGIDYFRFSKIIKKYCPDLLEEKINDDADRTTIKNNLS